MTTLLVAKDAGLEQPACTAHTDLRNWLQGHWALLFSDPEDFAPPPSTPSGFIVNVAQELRHARTKPVAVIDRPQQPAVNSWLYQASQDHALLVLEAIAHRSSTSGVVDFATRVLANKLLRLEPPYVLVLDDHGRCRSTISYRTRRTDPPRSLQELLCVVFALRRDSRVDVLGQAHLAAAQ